MVLQNYQNLIEMTSNLIDIVAFGVGIKFPRKIHLNTQCRGGREGVSKIAYFWGYTVYGGPTAYSVIEGDDLNWPFLIQRQSARPRKKIQKIESDNEDSDEDMSNAGVWTVV